MSSQIDLRQSGQVISSPMDSEKRTSFVLCLMIAIGFPMAVWANPTWTMTPTNVAIIALITFVLISLHYVFVFRLADHVIATPHELIIRRGKRGISIPATQIVSAQHYKAARYAPERITIRVPATSPFGSKIAFCPIMGFESTWPQSENTRWLFQLTTLDQG